MIIHNQQQISRHSSPVGNQSGACCADIPAARYQAQGRAHLFARLRGAYLDLCERQVSKLQHQIAVDKATNDDDTLDDLEGEAARLAAKIAARRQALRRRPHEPEDDFED